MAARLPEETVRRLREAARNASANAYAPYSELRVGAACLTAGGRIFTGVNVENASYGLTVCAERNAVFQAVAAGEQDIRAVLVYTSTAEPTTPCGACRQVLSEFGDDIAILCHCDGDAVLEASIAELLPHRFRL